nr:MAG TPA: hypothetical protein [Caudoviricetes sp.]
MDTQETFAHPFLWYNFLISKWSTEIMNKVVKK